MEIAQVVDPLKDKQADHESRLKKLESSTSPSGTVLLKEQVALRKKLDPAKQ